MPPWLTSLRYDPLGFLLNTKSEALRYFVQRDLQKRKLQSTKLLWNCEAARKILTKQHTDGRWSYPGGGIHRIRGEEDYDQIETYRQLGNLIEKFGFNREHSAIRGAAEFVFSKQTEEGDIRGIYGNQYTPNYTAGMLELLVKAGYQNDHRTEKAFQWLCSVRQDDGGWAIPFRTAGTPASGWIDAMKSRLVTPDRSKSSSHLVTGIVLRALVAHSAFRFSAEASSAGKFLCGRLFKSDTYPDRKSPEFWWKVSFPFWFTDAVSVLDSLSSMDFASENRRMTDALNQLVGRQCADGSFRVGLLRTGDKETKRWVCLAICRILNRMPRTSSLRLL